MDHFSDPLGTESHKPKPRPDLMYVCVYIYIYAGLRWQAAATEMRPGAPPKSCGYVYTGPGEVSSLVTDPPGTPVTPRNI